MCMPTKMTLDDDLADALREQARHTDQPFEQLANDYDFYGDVPAQIEAVAIENDRMPKEIFFIPALLILLVIVAIQRPRATQPAF